jgi:P27 family predicted phage terminase small subunit
MEEVERFDKMLNGAGENNYVYQTHNSYGDAILKENPAVALREKACRHVHALLVEFGLTPSASQKVGGGKEKPKKNDFQGF